MYQRIDSRFAKLHTENFSTINAAQVAVSLYHLGKIMQMYIPQRLPDGVTIFGTGFNQDTDIPDRPTNFEINAETQGVGPVLFYHLTEGKLSFRPILDSEHLGVYLDGSILLVTLFVSEVGGGDNSWTDMIDRTNVRQEWDVYRLIKPSDTFSGMNVVVLGELLDLVDGAFQYLKICLSVGTHLHLKADWVVSGSFISEDKKREYLQNVGTHLTIRGERALGSELNYWAYLRSLKGLVVTNAVWTQVSSTEVKHDLQLVVNEAGKRKVVAAIPDDCFLPATQELFTAHLRRS